MPETKKERLDMILARFGEVGQIKAVGIVSKEGLLITASMPSEMNERIVAALCSTIMASAETASTQMGTGTVSDIHVKTEQGTILLQPAGEKAILIALAESGAQLGLIMMEIETRAKQVQEILEEV